MSTIKKRVGTRGTTYQVRYSDKSVASGYAYATFRTMKEARAFSENASSWKQRNSPAVLSVPEAVDLWLKICQTEGRDGRDPVTTYTYKGYCDLAGVMKTYRWTRNIYELTAPDIVEFRSWLVSNYSRYRAAKTLSCFQSVMNEMAVRGHIQSNVASGISVRKDTRYSAPVEIPTLKEVQSLLSAADALANSKNAQIAKAWERYRPLLYLAVDSGMRPQEYLVLAGENISDTGIHVRRALERGGKLSVPKTPASRRFIEISPETLAMVEHYRDHHAKPNAYDLVFPTDTGSWLSLGNWRRRGFVMASEKAGLVEIEHVENREIIRPKYTPYSLRHFFASMLIEQRLNLKKIQTVMGHKDITTTLNVYGHLIEQADDRHNIRQGMLASIGNH